MNNNIKNFIKQQGNPKEILLNMLQNNNNPMINNLLQMAKSGNSNQVETFARNYFSEHGRNFDKEFSEFMQNFKR